MQVVELFELRQQFVAFLGAAEQIQREDFSTTLRDAFG